MTLEIMAFGGGTNSLAVLIEKRNRRERPPDAILFADTGGEQEHTYEATARMDTWCARNGFPPITRVQKVDASGEPMTLEQHCLDAKMLPSLAYGFKKCSQKFKRAPQDKWVNNWEPARAAWARGERVTKIIGFDADEPQRAARGNLDDPKYVYRYPLIEWGMGREECIEVIKAEGIPLPGKSSCFYCPASTVPEILALPDHLKARAIAMEDNAKETLGSVVGLGRRFAWKPLILNNNAQGDMFIGFANPIACDCYDGET